MMPSWKAAAILGCWALILLVVFASYITAACAGIVLWAKHGVRCPGIGLLFCALILVLVLSLPLIS